MTKERTYVFGCVAVFLSSAWFFQALCYNKQAFFWIFYVYFVLER